MADGVEVYSIERFIADARAVIAEHGVTEAGLAELGHRLRMLAAEDVIILDAELDTIHGSQARSRVLYTEVDGSLTLVLARFPQDRATPIHDHGTWGLLCVARGTDRYVHWERLDDGSLPGHAELQIAFERTLGPGDVVSWLDPPGDIHSQQGHDGETAYELVFFGRNPMSSVRHYFDPKKQTVWEANIRG